jgi:tripartite-type tricarboxylate transporter receptor subunit TctC
MKLKFAAAALAAALMAVAGIAAAQTFPTKPVRMVVTYPPGGSSDLMGRILAQKLTDLWGQQVLVENKSGAAGSIGMDYAAKLPADGYSFVIGNFGPVATNPILSKVPYDVQKDFHTVSMVCTGPQILVVNANSPIKNVAELVAAAKKDPGRIDFGTSGPGSMSHLVGEMFKKQAGIDIVQVPYKGGVLAVQDLLAGQVQMIFSDALPVMQHIRAGKLRALAVTSKTRSPLFPNLPTIDESGAPGYEDITFNGLVAPAGTPREIIVRVNEEVGRAVRVPALSKRFLDRGVELKSSATPEEFAALVKAEFDKKAKLAREAGIKID